MDISAQYLEGGHSAAGISAEEARSRLRETFELVPLVRVLLGWDLDLAVVEACANECARHRCDLYLWQPLLAEHGAFPGDPRWRVIGLGGRPAPGLDATPEFTFICPNRIEARVKAREDLSSALAGGHYQGIFLDRIRYPSPASDFSGQFACFCDACRAAARASDLDLLAVQSELLRLLPRREGRHAMISAMLSSFPPPESDTSIRSFSRMLDFRQKSISSFVAEITEAARSSGLKVGLDCFSPALARMVGQDLSTLAKCADWIKVMTYARAFAPASLPYEAVGLADWLMSIEGETEQAAIDCIAGATGWQLPTSRDAIRAGGLSASVLTQELQRGRSAGPRQLLAGVELVEIPSVVQLNPRQIRLDAEAVHAAMPDGVVLSWDLWHMPADRLELAGPLYGGLPGH
jgi:hypothetical protein